MNISAIWLRRSGDKVIVDFEYAGNWHKAIVENIDGNFSHIVELDITGKGPEAGQPRNIKEFSKETLEPEVETCPHGYIDADACPDCCH